MKPNNKFLFVGAVLTMIAAYLVVVAHKNVAGNILFIFSNMALYYYTVTVIWEYCQKMLNPPQETNGK